MNFGARTPEPEARRIVDRALERGASLFDTANVYGDGASELLLGKALGSRRAQAQVATKVGLRRGQPEGLSRQQVLSACDESLSRLGCDWIDLYYLHVPDPSTAIEETLEALQTLLQAGKIRSWGVSNFASWRILELFGAADALGMPRPAVSQVLYNLLIRQLDLEYFAFTRRHAIHTSVYNPLAGGLLARAPQRGSQVPPGSRFETNRLYRRRYWSDALLEHTQQLVQLSREGGMELVTLAYAWLARRPGVDSILAGPATVAQLDAALDAVSVAVPAELCARIDDLHRAFLGTDATYAR